LRAQRAGDKIGLAVQQQATKGAYMANFNDLVNRYIATFNETDPERRRRLIGDLYTATARYTDPQVELEGTDQIEAFIAGTQEHFPGYAFSLGGDIDAHHGQARFNWLATAPGQSEPAYIGFDVLVAEDGRVSSVYGFIDKAPAA
jgi:hypothetical protein